MLVRCHLDGLCYLSPISSAVAVRGNLAPLVVSSLFLWVELEHVTCVCLFVAGCYLDKDGDDVSTTHVF